MLRKKYYIIVLSLVICAIILFPQLKKNENSMNYDITNEIKEINNERIFFGHKSVGNNILQGIKEISTERLAILNINNASELPNAYILEANIGDNGNPKGKIDEFTKIVNQLAQNRLTIAMMKLCFVDLKENSNVNEIFNYYSAKMDSLRIKYPDLVIIHFTVPLTSKRTILSMVKDFIKGRSNKSMLDNVIRNKYNELIFSKYPNNLIFDLAKFESTYPDGSQEQYIYNGKHYNSLVPDYTDDGGHLNEKGRQMVAKNLISFLAEKVISKQIISN